MINNNNRPVSGVYIGDREIMQIVAGQIPRPVYMHPTKIRYVRDTIRGNSVNQDAHWVEIKVHNQEGRNVAYNITPTLNQGGRDLDSSRPISRITDANLDANVYYGTDNTSSGRPRFSAVTIDLGQIHDVNNIVVYHYYLDNRTYYSKLEVSQDGVYWTTIFNSIDNTSQRYRETHQGKTHNLRNHEY